MEEGQAATQPETAHDAALSIVGNWLPEQKQEDKQGKPEAAPVEETAEAPQEETQEATAQAEIRKHKLKVKAEGGADEEVEVDDNELKSGYMRQRDYQRKTAEVARDREAVAERIKQAVEPRVTEYQQRLQLIEKTLLQVTAPELQNTDWNKLAEDNPAEWARKTQRLSEINNAMSYVRQEQQRIAVEQQNAQRQALAQHMAKAEEVLQAEIPGWGEELKRDIAKTAVKLGFSKEELSTIADPRAIKVLHAAHQWDKLQGDRAKVEKKVADVPKVSKPGTAEKNDPKADKWKDAAGRIKKSQGKDQEALLDAARMLV